MMEGSDTLLTVAEISVAFAGFAGIASVVARSRESVDSRVNAVRLHNMVDIALSVVLLAFAPILLWEVFSPMLGDAGWFWRITSAFALVWSLAMYRRLNKRSQPVEHLAGYDMRGHKRLKVLAFVGLLLIMSNVVFPNHNHVYAAYLACVFFALTACGMLFMRILNALLVVDAENTDVQEEESDRE